MPPTLHATLSFDDTAVEELVQAHVESQGYFVEDIHPDENSRGYQVSVRPMTQEELLLHDLPTESVEDRLQIKIDSLVEETQRAFGSFASHIEKQARDTEIALESRLDDLRALSSSAQQTMLEIQSLAEKQRATPVFVETPTETVVTRSEAVTETRLPAPKPEPTIDAEPLGGPVSVMSTGAPSGSYETLSFADAVAALQEDASASNPDDHTRQRRFTQLHEELSQEAAVARDPIPGESSAFPSDLVTQ